MTYDATYHSERVENQAQVWSASNPLIHSCEGWTKAKAGQTTSHSYTISNEHEPEILDRITLDCEYSACSNLVAHTLGLLKVQDETIKEYSYKVHSLAQVIDISPIVGYCSEPDAALIVTSAKVVAANGHQFFLNPEFELGSYGI